MHEQVVPGCRVKVRFAGRDVDGFVVARADDDRSRRGARADLRAWSSSGAGPAPGGACAGRARSPTATPARWPTCSGSPCRRATPGSRREEPRPRADRARPAARHVDRALGGGARRRGLPRRRLSAGRVPAGGVDGASPAGSTGPQLAAAAAATPASGRGSLLLAPDARDVARLDGALTALLGSGRHVVLTRRPRARPRATAPSWPCRRGQVQIVRRHPSGGLRSGAPTSAWSRSGTTATTSYAEPRAPYPHAREVLLLRAHSESAAVLLAGHGRSVEAQALVESGWAVEPRAPPRPSSGRRRPRST